MFTAEVERSTLPLKDSVLTGLVEDTGIERIQVGYDAARERVKTCCLMLVGEANGNIIHQEKMNELLMRIIEALSQSDRFVDTLVRRVVGCYSLIIPITAHVKCLINRTGYEHRLGQNLQQQFSKSSYQSSLDMAKMEVEVVTPLPSHRPRTIRMKEVDEDKIVSWSQNKRSIGTFPTRMSGDVLGKRSSKSRKASVSKEY